MPRARRFGASQHLVGAPGAWVNRRSGRQHKMSAPNGQRSDLWLKRRCPQALRSSQATVGQVMSPESPPRGTGQSMARTGRPTFLQARPLPQAALHCPRSAARRARTLTPPALPPARVVVMLLLPPLLLLLLPPPPPPRRPASPAPPPLPGGRLRGAEHSQRARS